MSKIGLPFFVTVFLLVCVFGCMYSVTRSLNATIPVPQKAPAATAVIERFEPDPPYYQGDRPVDSACYTSREKDTEVLYVDLNRDGEVDLVTVTRIMDSKPVPLVTYQILPLGKDAGWENAQLLEAENVSAPSVAFNEGSAEAECLNDAYRKIRADYITANNGTMAEFPENQPAPANDKAKMQRFVGLLALHMQEERKSARLTSRQLQQWQESQYRSFLAFGYMHDAFYELTPSERREALTMSQKIPQGTKVDAIYPNGKMCDTLLSNIDNKALHQFIHYLQTSYMETDYMGNWRLIDQTKLREDFEKDLVTQKLLIKS